MSNEHTTQTTKITPADKNTLEAICTDMRSISDELRVVGLKIDKETGETVDYLTSVEGGDRIKSLIETGSQMAEQLSEELEKLLKLSSDDTVANDSDDTMLEKAS